MEFDLTWLQVDLDALEENMRKVRDRAGTDVLAVVKADAYGCGLNIYYLFLIKCARFQEFFNKEKLTPMLLTER